MLCSALACLGSWWSKHMKVMKSLVLFQRWQLNQRKFSIHLPCLPVLFISTPQINIAKLGDTTHVLFPLALVFSVCHHSQTYSLLHLPHCLSIPCPCLWILLFSSLHLPCFLHCSISIKNAASFMNSSKWSWTNQGGMHGGNKAKRWQLEQTVERKKEVGERRAKGGALLYCWILMSTKGNFFFTIFY